MYVPLPSRTVSNLTTFQKPNLLKRFKPRKATSPALPAPTAASAIRRTAFGARIVLMPFIIKKGSYHDQTITPCWLSPHPPRPAAAGNGNGQLQNQGQTSRADGLSGLWRGVSRRPLAMVGKT